MGDRYIVLRHELAANALGALAELYPHLLADLQMVKDGDGKALKAIHLGAYTPSFEPQAGGFQAAWVKQLITLEIRCEVDYRDRTLDARFKRLLQAIEDFSARTDLRTWLSSAEDDGIVVDCPPTHEAGAEEIVGDMFVVSYRMRVLARGKVNGA